MVECNVCKKEFKEDKNLHLHIKAQKLSIGDYYQTQFPRHDLHTKELIKFKNKEQYFSADFKKARWKKMILSWRTILFKYFSRHFRNPYRYFRQ